MTKGRLQNGLFYVCILDAINIQLCSAGLRMTSLPVSIIYFDCLLFVIWHGHMQLKLM